MNYAPGLTRERAIVKRLTSVWLWASVVLPALFGVFFLIAAPKMLEQTPAVAVAHQVGIRQLVYAGVLAFAILRLPRRVAAVLLVGRGVTDVLDGVDMLIQSGVSGPVLFPLIAGAISFGVAWVLSREPEATPA